MTALAISGSAAQSKINAYPADCDFFERVHILAETREEACAILGDLIREKALATRSGRAIGCGRSSRVAPRGRHDARRGRRAGSPMSWTPEEVSAGQMEVSWPTARCASTPGRRLGRAGLVQARLGHR